MMTACDHGRALQMNPLPLDNWMRSIWMEEWKFTQRFLEMVFKIIQPKAGIVMDPSQQCRASLRPVAFPGIALSIDLLV